MLFNGGLTSGIEGIDRVRWGSVADRAGGRGAEGGPVVTVGVLVFSWSGLDCASFRGDSLVGGPTPK